MRNSIEKSVITFANLIKDKGLFKAIQYILFGNQKNIFIL